MEGVIHPSLPLEKFKDAKFLFEHLVLLPIHQSLTSDELTFMIERLTEVIRNYDAQPKKVYH